MRHLTDEMEWDVVMFTPFSDIVIAVVREQLTTKEAKREVRAVAKCAPQWVMVGAVPALKYEFGDKLAPEDITHQLLA